MRVQVIAALSKRLRQMQAALISASDAIVELETAAVGLRQANKQIIELSQVRVTPGVYGK